VLGLAASRAMVQWLKTLIVRSSSFRRRATICLAGAASRARCCAGTFAKPARSCAGCRGCATPTSGSTSTLICQVWKAARRALGRSPLRWTA
jgi:hypothetical protein